MNRLQTIFYRWQSSLNNNRHSIIYICLFHFLNNLGSLHAFRNHIFASSLFFLLFNFFFYFIFVLCIWCHLLIPSIFFFLLIISLIGKTPENPQSLHL